MQSLLPHSGWPSLVPPWFSIRLWPHSYLPTRQSTIGGLNPSLYRTALRRGVFRRLAPEPLWLDIGLTVIDHSRGRHDGGVAGFRGLALVLAER